MNYIKRLEQQADERAASIANAEQAIREFRAHLLSPKFQGVDPDGDRRDWVAVDDVQRWLDNIDKALIAVTGDVSVAAVPCTNCRRKLVDARGRCRNCGHDANRQHARDLAKQHKARFAVASIRGDERVMWADNVPLDATIVFLTTDEDER